MTERGGVEANRVREPGGHALERALARSQGGRLGRYGTARREAALRSAVSRAETSTFGKPDPAHDGAALWRYAARTLMLLVPRIPDALLAA
jgi:hypothetical protein